MKFYLVVTDTTLVMHGRTDGQRHFNIPLPISYTGDNEYLMETKL